MSKIRSVARAGIYTFVGGVVFSAITFGLVAREANDFMRGQCEAQLQRAGIENRTCIRVPIPKSPDVPTIGSTVFPTDEQKYFLF